MRNHFHLVVETPRPNLSLGMEGLLGTYTARFNRRRKFFGHLFQGRYKAIVVDGRDRMYLQVVSTYIHLNPARAGLIRIGEQSLNTYRWSSYPAYLKADGKATPWLQRDKVLGSL